MAPNPYLVIIGISLIVIVSFGFNWLSQKTRIPSVLMLIVTGIFIALGFQWAGQPLPDLFGVLNILGVIGLMMIVLEGALDLHLKKEKSGLIFKSFLTALVILVGTAFLIAAVFMLFLKMEFYASLVYAVPLAVISSAIVIPSVQHLSEKRKEFLIYDSTFSDILGIMFFDFLIFENATPIPTWAAISGNVVVSIVASLVLSIVMIVLMQRVRSRVKLFLFISVLALVFALGKYFHFSALLIVLFFGLILANPGLFFRGPLSRFHKENILENITHEFVIITEESAFLIRTLFFVVFGMYMDLGSLVDWHVLLLGILLLVIIFGFRTAGIRLIKGKKIMPDSLIAPRGLITILLFFKIPDVVKVADFKEGILFFVILGSSIVMMIGLMRKLISRTDPESVDTLMPEGEEVTPTGEGEEPYDGSDDSILPADPPQS